MFERPCDGERVAAGGRQHGGAEVGMAEVAGGPAIAPGPAGRARRPGRQAVTAARLTVPKSGFDLAHVVQQGGGQHRPIGGRFPSEQLGGRPPDADGVAPVGPGQAPPERRLPRQEVGSRPRRRRPRAEVSSAET